METKAKTHREFGVELFNYVWDLLDKPERTQEEDDSMLNAAHASRYHWENAGTALNVARGEWQIARVYATLKRAEPATYHARRCLEICLENGYGDFDLAFAYEALARASKIEGDTASRDKYLEQAAEASKSIAEGDDRKYFLSELKTIPGSDKFLSNGQAK